MSNVSFILVCVEDIAASAAFDASVLGRPAIESLPTFAMPPAGPDLMRRGGMKPAAPSGPRAEIALTASKAEVDAMHAEWRSRGVAVVQAPTAMDFGYTFVALDPNGQRLRVFAPAAT